MTETQDRIEAIAERLWKAQESGVPCRAPSEDYPELNVDDAYKVQETLIGRRGARQVGRKIGLTSPAIQQWLKVSEPDFGILLDEMMVQDGMVASMKSLLQPRVEAEVAFVLKEDLRGPGITAADVIQATDFVLPALEIIDSRIADWNITFEDTIADNASSGLFVLGNRPRKLEEIELRLAGMSLKKNGRVVSTGAGAACLGDPVNALVWLANKLAAFDAYLGAGEVILSGALGPVTNVVHGDFVSAEISGLGSVRVRFGE